MSGEIYRNQDTTNRFARTTVQPGLSSVTDRKAFYRATSTEAQVTTGQLLGDEINWTTANYLDIDVLRDNGGFQFPLVPGFMGDGVDLLEPGVIKFTPSLVAGERIMVRQRSRVASVARQIEPIFPTTRLEVAAASTQSIFTLSRPGKLTFLNGINRGQTAQVFVDGNLMRVNTPDTSDGDYTENQTVGSDTFGSITFNVAVGDPLRAINVTIDHKGFYDADNISLQQLIGNTTRITTLEGFDLWSYRKIDTTSSQLAEAIRFTNLSNTTFGIGLTVTDNGSDATRITVNYSGLLWITASIPVSITSTAYIEQNNATNTAAKSWVSSTQASGSNSAGTGGNILISASIKVSAGDFFKFYLSAGTLTASALGGVQALLLRSL